MHQLQVLDNVLCDIFSNSKRSWNANQPHMHIVTKHSYNFIGYIYVYYLNAYNWVIFVTVWQSLNAECKVSCFCVFYQLFTWEGMEKAEQLHNVRLYGKIKYILLLIRLTLVLIDINGVSRIIFVLNRLSVILVNVSARNFPALTFTAH